MKTNLIVTTTNSVKGHRIGEYLGIVRGISVRVPTLGQGFQAIGNALSGNLQAGAEMYAEVCETARVQAYRHMVEQARELGADAIIGMRYDATEVGESATEIFAYGTAVQFQVPDALPAQAARTP
jgi:uncharacterized protein YbjQ (UPF0145 family)